MQWKGQPVKPVLFVQAWRDSACEELQTSVIRWHHQLIKKTLLLHGAFVFNTDFRWTWQPQLCHRCSRRTCTKQKRRLQIFRKWVLHDFDSTVKQAVSLPTYSQVRWYKTYIYMNIYTHRVEYALETCLEIKGETIIIIINKTWEVKTQTNQC